MAHEPSLLASGDHLWDLQRNSFPGPSCTISLWPTLCHYFPGRACVESFQNKCENSRLCLDQLIPRNFWGSVTATLTWLKVQGVERQDASFTAKLEKELPSFSFVFLNISGSMCRKRFVLCPSAGACPLQTQHGDQERGRLPKSSHTVLGRRQGRESMGPEGGRPGFQPHPLHCTSMLAGMNS